VLNYKHTERLISYWILSLEPERRKNRSATTGSRNPGKSPGGFYLTIKLLALSDVLRRNVLPSSKVSR
jgi:hypothetical protein